MHNKFFIALFLVAGLVAVTKKSVSQDKEAYSKLYAATGIPDSLKEDANAVVRYSNQQIKVLPPNRQVIKYHAITTVLNEKGDREATLAYGYDKKYNYFSYINITIYNADGKLIKKYRKSDSYDRAASDDETMVTDDRILYLRHVIPTYPATIEVDYELNINSAFNIADWNIQPRYHVSVQQSACKVTIDPSLKFRYKTKNINLAPVKGTEDGQQTYSWDVKNLKALKPEDDALAWQVMPKVLFMTDNFQCYGTTGSIESWESYGKWQQQLNEHSTDLSPQRVQEIRQMTDSIKTDKGKAQFLYHYMQQNTRYIGIQLGIGGFKPFPAEFVDQKKYGDCKALSNYMSALLKAVNIPSYYAIINAGTNEEAADPAFTADYFNHVILCIPFKNDTTWLECTSNTQPFGKLGAFTENRYALLVTETGGKLVHTPQSQMMDNQLNSVVHLTLDGEGGAKAKVTLDGIGDYRDSYIALMSMKPDEQKEGLLYAYRMKEPAAFNLAEASDRDGVKELNLDLEYDKFCDIMSGDKQFYHPQVFDLWTASLPSYEHRHNDFYFEHAMQKTCTTIIDLPAGFEAESVPSNVNLNCPYGTYQANYSYDKTKNQITGVVKFNINTQVIPAKKYTEMQQYLDGILKAQNKKLVIHRKSA